MLLRTLGGLALEGSGFRRPKLLLLLAYLAIEGPKPRRHLADLFWPGELKRLKSLSMAFTRLRQGAPGVLGVDELRAWAVVRADVQDFLEASDKHDSESVLAFYRGPFLEGVYLSDWGVELEEWIYTTREFLARHLREALFVLAEKDARAGRFEAAAKRAEAAFLLQGAPALDRVELHRLHTLMLAGGDQHAADVRMEAEGFGIALFSSPNEARVHLTQAESSSQPHVSRGVPRRNTPFVGRDLELTEIAGLLAQSDCSLLTLVGAGGVGKTRLALQVASEQSSLAAFEGGVHFVPLDALSAGAQLPARLAEAIGCSLQGSEEPISQIIRYLGERNVLLVLDNFEHLVSVTPLLSVLIAGCPGLKLLVTSRERLDLEEEQIFPLEGLPFPATREAAVSLEDAQGFDAVRLFEGRAQRAHPDFRITETELPHVLRICRLVEGIPLALELAATWVRAMPCAEIAEEIAHNLAFLEVPTRNVPARHRSLRATFGHSWDLLSPREQNAIRKLSVFRGGFRRNAASEVAEATIPLLASLVDKSLLRVMPTGRYDRHLLLYEFTREKLAEHPEEQADAQEKHARYFLHLLGQWNTEMRGGDQTSVLRAFREESENIRIAWAEAVTKEWVEALETAAAPLTWCYDMLGLYHEGLRVIGHATEHLNKAKPRHRVALGRVLTRQALLHLRLGNLHKVAEAAQESLALLRPLGDKTGIMAGVSMLGQIAMRTGDYAQARLHFAEALELAEREGDTWSAANFGGNLAIVEQSLGNYTETEAYLRNTLALHEATNDKTSVVIDLNNLGNLKIITNHFEEAKQFFQEALGLAREIATQSMLPMLLNNLGLAAKRLRDYSLARSCYTEALSAARDIGHVSDEAWSLSHLGMLALAHSDYSQAQSHLSRSLKTFSSIGDVPMMLNTLILWAKLSAAQGRYTEAVSFIGLVKTHPATDQPDQKFADKVLTELKSHLSPEAFAVGLEDGKQLVLTEVVQQLSQQSLTTRP